MKPLFALCIILFSLHLFGNLSYGRKEMGNYWKKMTENQPMPEAIKDLLVKDPASVASDAEKKDRFVRDFDIRPNIILYHTHVVSEKKKPLVKKFEQIAKKGL